jgi:hypothetical protein
VTCAMRRPLHSCCKEAVCVSSVPGMTVPSVLHTVRDESAVQTGSTEYTKSRLRAWNASGSKPLAVNRMYTIVSTGDAEFNQRDASPMQGTGVTEQSSAAGRRRAGRSVSETRSLGTLSNKGRT